MGYYCFYSAFNSIAFAANATQVFSDVAAFSVMYFPASMTTDAGIAHASSLMRIVCETHMVLVEFTKNFHCFSFGIFRVGLQVVHA